MLECPWVEKRPRPRRTYELQHDVECPILVALLPVNDFYDAHRIRGFLRRSTFETS